MKKFFRANKFDYIVFFSIILAAGLLGGLFILAGSSQPGGRAVISISGQEYKTVSLKENRSFEIPGMLVETEAGRIRVAESQCPKKICLHTGWISSPGESIVCVPYKTIISVSGENNEYDALTY